MTLQRPPDDATRRITSVWGEAASLPAGRTLTIRTARIAATPMPAGLRLLRRRLGADAQADYRPAGWKLGEGGMGQVIAAEQTVLGRDVALKRLHAARAADADSRSGFLAEAAVTADLEHPNIIPIHDLGIDEGGIPFYAMKLAAGTTWDACMERLTLAENLEILLKVCDAVGYAHSRGIIHRDLKPENVMVGGYGEVLVLDWGLAASVRPGTRAPDIRTSANISGTPAFMSPEAALGIRSQINEASDIYLLGALLYHIISGRPPHDGEDVHQILLAAARNEVAPVAGGGDLDAIARRAMDSDPARRHQAVAEFAADIRSWRQNHASIRLGRSAGRDLERAREGGSYERFAQACFAFREALRLWPGNAVAQVGLSAARQAWAERALANGDLDLASAQADPRDPDHRRLIARIDAARALQRRRRLAARIATVSVAALAVAIPLAVAAWAGLSWWQERRLRDTTDTLAAAQRLQQRAERAAERTVVQQRDQASRRALAFGPFAEAQDLLLSGQSPARAAELLRQAAELDPTSPETLFALGEALAASGRPGLAVEPFLAADAAARAGGGGGYQPALVHAALAALAAGDSPAAADAARRAAATAPATPLGRVAAAWSAALDGTPCAAVPDALAAAAGDQLDWECQLVAGIICHQAASDGAEPPAPLHAKARTLLRQSLALAPREALTRELLVEELSWTGTPEDQRERALHLAWLDRHRGDDPACDLGAAVRLAAAGRGDEAANLIARADRSALRPGQLAAAAAELAACDGDQSRLAAALAPLTSAAAIEPATAALLARICLDRPELAPTVHAALPGSRHAPGVSGDILDALRPDGDPRGREALDRGLAGHPWNAELLDLLASDLQRQHRWTELEPVARKACEVRPAGGRQRLRLAQALIGLGRIDEARPLLAEARRLDPRLGDEAGRMLRP